MKKSARTGQTEGERLREHDSGVIAGNRASQCGCRTGGARRTISAADYQTGGRTAEHEPYDLGWFTACRPAARADAGIRAGVGARSSAAGFHHECRYTFAGDKTAGLRQRFRVEARRRE